MDEPKRGPRIARCVCGRRARYIRVGPVNWTVRCSGCGLNPMTVGPKEFVAKHWNEQREFERVFHLPINLWP